MLVFPHAKINLGLNVVERRSDGFHEIESVLVPIPLCDVLEVVLDPGLAMGEVVHARSGLAIEGNVEHDLCMRAVRSIAKDHRLPGLRMHLHKVIPTGAGLGGGSSDGAHALMLLDSLLKLGLGSGRLAELAMELGSDCPFFLGKGAAVATGRGERLSPITLDLEDHWLALVNPGIHVQTAEVYAHTVPTGKRMDPGKMLPANRIEDWGAIAPNVMEPYVFNAYPEVGAIKQQLLGAGAAHAAMSGSGSSVFGLFKSEPPPLTWPASYMHWTFRPPFSVQQG